MGPCLRAGYQNDVKASLIWSEETAITLLVLTYGTHREKCVGFFFFNVLSSLSFLSFFLPVHQEYCISAILAQIGEK